MPRLLLLEDDRSLIDGLTYSLEKNGFETEIAGTVKEAEKQVTEDTDFDLLLFDVMLPDGNGIALCEKLRSLGIRTPIIFLTASDEETSVIRGLDCGGDDYITKPFKLGELCSRIRALLRRFDRGNAGIIFCGRESWWSAWQKEKYSQRENRWSLPDQNTGFCVCCFRTAGGCSPGT